MEQTSAPSVSRACWVGGCLGARRPVFATATATATCTSACVLGRGPETGWRVLHWFGAIFSARERDKLDTTSATSTRKLPGHQSQTRPVWDCMPPQTDPPGTTTDRHSDRNIFQSHGASGNGSTSTWPSKRGDRHSVERPGAPPPQFGSRPCKSCVAVPSPTWRNSKK